MASRISDSLQLSGSLTCESVSLRSGTIPVARLGHRHAVTYSQASGAVVVTETKLVHIANGGGTLSNVDVVVDTAPTGGDKAFTVDVKKSTGGGAFASVLSAVETINSSDTAKTVYSPTITATTYTAGDIYEVVITTSGSTGTQGYGVCVTITLDEDYA